MLASVVGESEALYKFKYNDINWQP